MADEQVDLLKVRFGAETDQDLAAKMGVERSAVAQWRKRGIPKRYRYVVAHGSPADQVIHLLRDGIRTQVFGRLENHYFLKAALAFYQPDPNEASDPATLGVQREGVILGLMSVAAQTTLSSLGKRRCEDETDYQALVVAMARGPAAIEAVVTANRVLNKSPQSSSSSELSSETGQGD